MLLTITVITVISICAFRIIYILKQDKEYEKQLAHQQRHPFQ